MTNTTRLHKAISFLSAKMQELAAKVKTPAYGILAQSQYESVIRMHYMFDLAMKIIWLCENILELDAPTEIEDREPLKIDLLMSSLYEPYTRRMEYFFAYLSEWRQSTNDIKRIFSKYKELPTPKHYFCDELQYRFDLDYEA